MDVLSNLQKLPEVCAVYHPTSQEPVLIRRGIQGYHEVVQPAGFSVEKFNYANGVTTAQQSAMLHGSMFGWDCPAADRDNPINQDKVAKEAVSVTRNTAAPAVAPSSAEITDMAKRLAPLPRNGEPKHS